MNRNAKTLRQEIDGCRYALPPEQWARLDAAWRALQPRRRERKDLGIKGRTREQRRAEHREATAKLRTELLLLTEGYCENCGLRASPAEGHMHHCRGGSGRRRSEQRIETVAWLCPQCHRWMHDHPIEAKYFALKIEGRRMARAAERSAP